MIRCAWRHALIALAVGACSALVESRGQDAPAGAEAQAEDDAPTPDEGADEQGDASDDELRAERDRLWEQAQRLRQEGKLVEAAAAGEEMLAIERRWLGQEVEDFVISLESLASVYEQAEDWARAKARRQEALAWREAHQGGDHWETIDARLALENVRLLQGLSAAEQGQLAVARAKHAQVIEFYGQGQYPDAIGLAEEVSVIRGKVLGEEHPDYALSLNNLAGLYSSMGDYARAEPLFRQALGIRKVALGEQHPDYALSLNNLAWLYSSMGDYARAEPLYRQALGIRKVALGEQHPDYATSLDNLAELYRSMGDYARAEPLYRQASEIFKQALGEQHPDYATSLNNLAALYRSMGDYARAEPLYRQALGIRKQVLGEQHPDYAQSLNNLAELYRSMGDYARAEPLYRQALGIRKQALGEEHPDYAQSLNNLAELYRSMGDYARAEPFYRQALDIYKEALGEQHPDYATSLNNLAGLYRSMGDSARAEPLYRQALEIYKQALGEQHPSYALSLKNLAGLYDSMGDSARAEPLYEKALAIVAALAEATAAAQDEAGQLRMGQSVQSYLDSYLSCLLKSGDDASAAYRAVLNWKGATLVRQRAARLAAADPELAPIFTELQGVVRQWSTLAGGASPGGPDVRARIAELASRKEQLERELSRRSAAFRAATEEVEIADVQAALPPGAVLVDYFEFWYSEPSKIKKGQRDWRRSLAAFVVRPDGAVAMFDLGPMEPISAAIDAWRADFGASAPARDAGNLLRKKLWTPLAAALGDAKLVLVSPDRALGKLPLAALPGSEPGTYLIEDVALALVPVPQLIPALVADKERPELPRDLLVLGGVKYDRGAADASAALAQGSAPRRPWERGIRESLRQQEVVGEFLWEFLPGTDSEAAYVAGLYQRLMGLPVGSERIVHLRGAGATEEEFRRRAGECSLLHLATHGFFASEDKPSALAVAATQRDALRDNPFGDRLAAVRGYSPGLLSGLVLAGANDPPKIPDDPEQLATVPDDGYLTAEEIAFMPLSGVQLVVLSACESGLGEAAGGEGLLGIQRAFQIAGARTTIATLWKVNDEATRRIMEEFYRNYLDKELSPLEALRAAQLWALNNPDLVPRGAAAPADEEAANGERLRRLSPEFWAAFTLSGDWR